MIILGGPWTGGRGSEIADLRENLSDLGHLAESMAHPDTPADRRIVVNLDGGPQGARGVLCGANVRMPHRTPSGGKLAREEIDYNNWLAGKRAMIENNFADIKDNAIFGTRFRGSVHDLEEAGAVAVGLANFKRIRRRRKGFVPDTHRRQPKPGPMKPWPRGRKPCIDFKKQPKRQRPCTSDPRKAAGGCPPCKKTALSRSLAARIRSFVPPPDSEFRGTGRDRWSQYAQPHRTRRPAPPRRRRCPGMGLTRRPAPPEIRLALSCRRPRRTGAGSGVPWH